MSDISETATGKRLQVIDSLTEATENNRLKWRRIAKDTFEVVVKNKGFRISKDSLSIQLVTSEVSLWDGFSDWLVTFQVDSFVGKLEFEALEKLWKAISDSYDTDKADEFIEFLTGSGVLQK